MSKTWLYSTVVSYCDRVTQKNFFCGIILVWLLGLLLCANTMFTCIVIKMLMLERRFVHHNRTSQRCEAGRGGLIVGGVCRSAAALKPVLWRRQSTHVGTHARTLSASSTKKPQQRGVMFLEMWDIGEMEERWERHWLIDEFDLFWGMCFQRKRLFFYLHITKNTRQNVR